MIAVAIKKGLMMMKKDYESPTMEVFSFDTPDVVMDVGCPTFGCPTDGVCVVEVPCVADGTCTQDTECILDGQCILDGVSGV
jgi:hypothetical protein